jgi:hypothetical protein
MEEGEKMNQTEIVSRQAMFPILFGKIRHLAIFNGHSPFPALP